MVKLKDVKRGTKVRFVNPTANMFKYHSYADFQGWGLEVGSVGIVNIVDTGCMEGLHVSAHWQGLNRPHFDPSQLWVSLDAIELVTDMDDTTS